MSRVCIIQARTGSTRLPYKVLFDLAGASMLERVIERVSGASSVFDKLVVATSTNPDDAVIVDICNSIGVSSFRGSESDVLDRYHRTAQAFGANEVIRICADDPFICPSIIIETVRRFEVSRVEYVSTETIRKSFPVGMHVEVFPAYVLRDAWFYAKEEFDREHVMPYVWKNLQYYNCLPVVADADYSDIRLTVDTIEDYRIARRLYAYLGNTKFYWKDVVEIVKGDRDGESAFFNTD